LPDRVQPIGYVVEVVVEQVGVSVEGHRRRGVAEHALDRLTFAPGLTAKLAAV